MNMKTTIIAGVLALIAIAAAVGFGQQERTFYLVCESNASIYSDFDRDTITVSTLRPEQIEFTSSGNKYSATKVDGYNFLSGGKGKYWTSIRRACTQPKVTKRSIACASCRSVARSSPRLRKPMRMNATTLACSLAEWSAPERTTTTSCASGSCAPTSQARASASTPSAGISSRAWP